MGVSIRAYASAELVRAGSWRDFSENEIDDAYGEGLTLLSNLDEFVQRGDGMPEGLYRLGDAIESWQASYTGYNRWRDLLCRSVLGVEPEEVWADYGAWSAKPMAPLIHFADNEGFLGPVTCRRLLDDANGLYDAPFLDHYQTSWVTWLRMFEVAADTGVITFS